MEIPSRAAGMPSWLEGVAMRRSAAITSCVPAPKRRAVDRCDHRYRKRTESSKHGLQIRRELALFDTVQVGASAKGWRGPGQDHCSRLARSARSNLPLSVEEFKQCWVIDGICVVRTDRG